jgi:glutamine amidotransferase
MRVALLDYGAGNLHSLAKALQSGGAAVSVTSSWDEAVSLDALVLPGVGSFGAAVASLGAEAGKVKAALEAGLPTLGICLGMQLLFERSEEGAGRGIGLLRGSVVLLSTPIIPQMGWNDVATTADPIFQGSGDLVAYFANSFVCAPEDPGAVIATTEYQGQTFPAAVRRGLAWGVQFHPEKSSGPGLRIIHNFLDLARRRSEGKGK